MSVSRTRKAIEKEEKRTAIQYTEDESGPAAMSSTRPRKGAECPEKSNPSSSREASLERKANMAEMFKMMQLDRLAEKEERRAERELAKIAREEAQAERELQRQDQCRKDELAKIAREEAQAERELQRLEQCRKDEEAKAEREHERELQRQKQLRDDETAKAERERWRRMDEDARAEREDARAEREFQRQEQHRKDAAAETEYEARRQEALDERRERAEQRRIEHEYAQAEETRREREMARREIQEAADREQQAIVRREKRRHKIATEIPPVGKLRDPKEIVHFLRKFKAHMVTYQVEEDQWPTLLTPVLDAKSASFMDRLDPEVQQDFQTLSDALAKANGVTTAFHKRRWYDTSWREGLSSIEAGLKFAEIAQSWIEEKTTRAEVMDHFVMERLIESELPAVKSWVRNRHPKSMEEAAALAMDYVDNNITPASNPPRPAYVPRRPFTRPDTEGAKSTPFASRESSTKHSERSGGEKTEKTRGPRCYACQQFGHIAANCPDNPRTPPVRVKTEEARMAVAIGEELLPLIAGTVDRQSVSRCVRDTGCSMSQVRAGLVKQDCRKLGDVRVIMADESTKSMPTTSVRLQVGGQSWHTRVVINPDLSRYDVLLGNDVPGLDKALRPSRTQRGKPRRNPPRQRRRPQRYGVASPGTSDVSTSNSPSSETPTDSSESSDEATPITSDSGEEASQTSDSDEEFVIPVQESGTEEPADAGEVEIPSPRENEQPETTVESRAKPKRSRADRRLERQRYAQKWGIDVDLEGGSARMLQLQLEDDSLAEARESTARRNSQFFWGKDDGLLYRNGKLPGPDSPQLEQLVLPTPYREQTLRMAHIAPLAGHFGVAKTANRVKRRFFWPGMRHDIGDLCRRCQTCQRVKPKHTPKAPLVPLPVVRTPFSRVAINMVGPLPATDEGHRYISTICDYGTRYPEAFTLKSTTSKDVAEALIEMFARTGIPDEILTDRGSNFTSDLMHELYEMLGIRGIRTSAYHPQTDGMVERFNGTLKTGLKKFVQDYQGQWHKALPFILFAYRETPHTTTGFSPFELLLGRNPTGPLDILKQEWTGPKSTTTDLVTFVNGVHERLEYASKAATAMEKEAKSQMKSQYDRGTKSQVFEVGDLVLVLKPSVAVKFNAQWRGPYTIIERLSSVTYVVKKADASGKTHTYHTNFLKRWESPSAVCLLNVAAEEVDEFPSWEAHPDEGEAQIGPEISTAQQTQLRDMLETHKAVFSNSPGLTRLAEIEIDTGEAKPVYTPPYRVPQSQLPAIREEVHHMLTAGIISPSTSAWGSPLLMVKKSDGTLRPVVDYRRLNRLTTVDPFPMPRIDDMLDGLASAQYISTLDLTKGYWQVPVAPESKAKTAFVTQFGKYHFNVMPFGLMGAPAVFQRLMNSIFGDAPDHVAAYMDDVVVFSSAWEEHLRHLDDALSRLEKAGLTVKAKKCQLAMKECVFLGHTVGRGQVKPDAAKIADLLEFKRPRTKKDVRSFLGLAGYYRRFVQDFASTATPLTDLTRDCCPDKVVWEDQHQAAFEKLISTLATDPVLRGPDYDKMFTVQTDASDRGIGAVLSQLDDEGHDRPVAFFSRKLLPREVNYAAVDKECLAIVDGIRHFQVYLTGVHFEVMTDHKCLEWLDSVRDAGGRRTRWSLRLQPFDFKIRHRPGIDNGNADGLSRQAWELERFEQDRSESDDRTPWLHPTEGGGECYESHPPGSLTTTRTLQDKEGVAGCSGEGGA